MEPDSPPTSHRPGCVTAYTLLLWSVAILFLLGLVLGSPVSAAAGRSVWPWFLTLIIFVLLPFVSGAGLWRMKKWGWWLVVLNQATGVIVAFFLLISTMLSRDTLEVTTAALSGVLGLLISGSILYWFIANRRLFAGLIAEPRAAGAIRSSRWSRLLFVGIPALVVVVLAGVVALTILAPTLQNVTIALRQRFGGPGAGVIVIRPGDDALANELVVVDTAGTELRRLTVDGVPSTGMALGGSGLTLWRLDLDAWYLLDAHTGQGVTLTLPGEQDSALSPMRQYNGTWAERWLLMADPRGEQIFLVDLQTGQGTELRSLLDPDEVFYSVFSHAFSSEGDYLVLLAQAGIWLIPTHDPAGARLITGGDTGDTVWLGFDDDGRRLLYMRFRRGPELEITVLSEHFDGSPAEQILSLPSLASVYPVPGGRDMLLVENDSVSVYSREQESATTLATFSGSPRTVYISGDGARAVLGYDDDDTIVWLGIDLQTSTARSLDALRGLELGGLRTPDRRWLVFTERLGGLGRATPVQFVALDLQSMETTLLLTVDAETTYLFPRFFFPPYSTPDGRFNLVSLKDGSDVDRLWLLDAREGAARVLLEDHFAFWQISPDGHWVTAMQSAGSGREPERTILLIDVESGARRDLGPGTYALWAP